MTDERNDPRNASRLPDEGQDPSGPGAGRAGTNVKVTGLGEHDRVGGSGPGPEPETGDPGLGIHPYGAADAAGGGYGSASGRSSGGTGDGEPGSPLVGSAMDDGTTSAATGATSAGPTGWLRGAAGAADDGERDESETIPEDGPGDAGSPVGNDNIREGRVRGAMGVGHPSAGQGEGG